jgi:microcystin-dependent protein
MSNPFLGQIILVGFTFAPRGWAFCQGQLLSISQNTALFSLLGTTYGGNGTTTFALPDLRGRVPVGFGQGPGLSNYDQGEVLGTENVVLLANQMPIHTHAISLTGLTATSHVKNAAGNQQSPVGNVPAVEAAGVTATYSDQAPDAVMGPAAVTVGGTATAANAGGSLPVGIVQPSLAMNYVIALQGIFPSRN